jgi:hypothetical protein
MEEFVSLSGHFLGIVAVCVSLTGLLLACAPGSTSLPGQPEATEASVPMTPSAGSTASVGDTETPSVPAESTPPAIATSRAIRPTPSGTHLPERVPVTTPSPVTGEVPSRILNAIVADLADRLRVAPPQIEITRAESVIWNDGSLGCPEPGMSYTQAQVRGYWVVLEYDGQSFDYRATEGGFFRLCQNPELLPPSTPASMETE